MPIGRIDTEDDLRAFIQQTLRGSDQARLIRQSTGRGTWTRVAATGGADLAFGANFADTNASYRCFWRKDGMGMVYLTGLAFATAAVASNGTMILLPVGLRPKNQPLTRYLPVHAFAAGVEVEKGVGVVGGTSAKIVVEWSLASGDAVALDGISWLAEF